MRGEGRKGQNIGEKILKKDTPHFRMISKNKRKDA